MTVLPHPVAPGQDDAFVAKALQVRSRNPAGCDKIAHESRPLRSAAAADAVHLAIDRPVFLFDRGIAVCLRTGDICASRRRARGTSRDAALAEYGFRARGRVLNRRTSDRLTEVVQIQMGSFDPPGTTYVPGLRENRYGKFTINLGVFVPEVAERQGQKPPNSFVREYHCCVRTRLCSGPSQEMFGGIFDRMMRWLKSCSSGS
jgi:Domain of unknown function (DUF4304)